MRLGDVEPGQNVTITELDTVARVYAHEAGKTLVLARRKKDIAFGGQIHHLTTWVAIIWRDELEVEPAGQLVIPLL